MIEPCQRLICGIVSRGHSGIAAVLVFLFLGSGLGTAADGPSLSGDSSVSRAGKEALDDATAAQQLMVLGYIDSSSTLFERSGVVTNEISRTQPGLNLYLSSHGAEAILIDMSGAQIHRWFVRAEQLAGAAPPPHHQGPWPLFWRKVHLLADGDLLAIHEGYGLVRLDRHSNIRWIASNGAHHDLWETDEGRVFVLARTLIQDPDLRGDGLVLEDLVLEINSSGEKIASWSILDGLRSSEHAHLLESTNNTNGDLLHSNSIQVVEPYFELPDLGIHAGDFIVSCRNIDAIVTLSPRTGSVSWVLAGATTQQHSARLHRGGQLTVFDNATSQSGSKATVIDVIDPSRRRSFPAATSPEHYSRCCGVTQLLANGNLLTTFTEASVALETDPSGNVVWEFRNPHRSVAPNRASDDEKAMLFEVQRVAFDRWPGDTDSSLLTKR